MLKIAVFADLHLPDEATTVKDTVLDWVLAEVQKLRVSGILCLGDMTAFGTLPAARRLGEKLRASNLPFWFTPGNAELRQGNDLAELTRLIGAATPPDELLLLDTPKEKLDPASRAKLKTLLAENSACNLLAASHHPLKLLPEADRALIEQAIARGIIGQFIAGHAHFDHSTENYDVVRGLDPDKAIGGPPGFAVFQCAKPGAAWRRKNIDFTAADAVSWPAEERAQLLGCLGISGMESPFETLQFATEERIPVFELRYRKFSGEEETFRALLGRWREAGGRIFSMHLPELRWCDDDIMGREELDRAVETSVRLGCDRVTFHVPAVSLREFCVPACYRRMLEETVATLRPLATAKITIGIENMHIKPGERNNPDRGFGYTIGECREWVLTLKKELGENAVGFHFDLGHARNNPPFSSMQPVSTWYAQMGEWINGCHLHQVTMLENGEMDNHNPITAPFEPLISLASLFLAWRTGRIGHVPLILEIRHGGGPDSWRTLRNYLAHG